MREAEKGCSQGKAVAKQLMGTKIRTAESLGGELLEKTIEVLRILQDVELMQLSPIVQHKDVKENMAKLVDGLKLVGELVRGSQGFLKGSKKK